MLTLPTENLDCLAGLTFQLFVFPTLLFPTLLFLPKPKSGIQPNPHCNLNIYYYYYSLLPKPFEA